MRPGGLEDLGLTNAIAAQATELDAATGLLARPELAQVRGLTGDMELVLYRVAQQR